jgi:hypothetical protein
LVAWQWLSGVQLEWVGRRDMEKAVQTIVHLATIFGRSSHPVIACDKREAFAQGSESDEAIQLSVISRMDCLASLAMTVWRASGVSTTTPLP